MVCGPRRLCRAKRYPPPGRSTSWSRRRRDQKPFFGLDWLCCHTQVERLCGGAPDLMLLTHMDDVADHNEWKARWPSMTRVMHAADIHGPDHWPHVDMRSVELQISADATLAPGVEAISTPGHSRGSLCFLVGDNLFTGDHLAYVHRADGSRRRGGWDADIPWRRVAATPRLRRGCDVAIPWRRVAATPRLPRGYSVETRTFGRGCHVDSPWRRGRSVEAAAETRTFGLRRIAATPRPPRR